MIDGLEDKYSERRATPDHEADAFLATLIEDLMDEWLLWANFQGKMSHPAFDQMVQFWAHRQVKGMELICGDPSIIDESLNKFLTLTEEIFSNGMFLFGSRPSRADIAIYGILSQLIIDPAPAALLRKKFNTTYRWVTLMEDLSGIEGSWSTLLKLSGTYHLPMLEANDRALSKGEKFFTVELDGKPYSRKAHNRHDGCLSALRDQYKILSHSTKGFLNCLLKETGCYAYLTEDQ